MTGTRPVDILRQLIPPDVAEWDRELVNRFAATRDQAAFAELVRRHGSVVLSVCRRVAGHSQDAEDAFQAVFLVLARKAGTISRPELLGNWLYGVAVRVAQKARRAAVRRRAREVQVTAMPDPAESETRSLTCLGSLCEIGPVLHEELSRLPAWYRDAVVLCDLRGVSRAEAAKGLGIPEGTLSSRLATGRKKLADRVARRGIALAVAAVPLALAEGRAAVPDQLFRQSCGLVADWAAGATLPAPVHRLAEGGFAMRKLMLAGAFAIVVAAGAAIAARPGEMPAVPLESTPHVERITAPNPDAIAVVVHTPDANAAFLGTPKLRWALDLPVGRIDEFAWSADGKSVAVRSSRAISKDGPSRNEILVVPDVRAEVRQYRWLELPPNGRLVGFSPDGKELVTALREYQLVSGFHQMQFWTISQEKVPADVRAELQLARNVALDAEPTYGYTFSKDWKSYRTVYRESRVAGSYRMLEVREVETATGISRKPLARVEGTIEQYVLSADGSRLFAISDQNEVAAVESATGKRLWTCPIKFASPVAASQPPGGLGGGLGGAGRQEYPVHLQAASNGKFVIASRSITTPVLLTADKGEPGPALENAELLAASAAPGCFSHDDRLLVLTGQRYTVREINAKPNFGGRNQMSIEATALFTTVWDTTTGKVVKTWDRSATATFLPNAPVLAVFENNGAGGTRLGFWDFAE